MCFFIEIFNVYNIFYNKITFIKFMVYSKLYNIITLHIRDIVEVEVKGESKCNENFKNF